MNMRAKVIPFLTELALYLQDVGGSLIFASCDLDRQFLSKSRNVFPVCCYLKLTLRSIQLTRHDTFYVWCFLAEILFCCVDSGHIDSCWQNIVLTTELYLEQISPRKVRNALWASRRDTPCRPGDIADRSYFLHWSHPLIPPSFFNV